MTLSIGIYDAPPYALGNLILDITPYVTSAQITTNQNGFEGLTATFVRPLAEAFRFYTQPGTLYIGVFVGGQIIWEGRIEDPSLTTGAVTGLTVKALGYLRALSDDLYTALWSKTTVEGFAPIQTTQIATYTPEKWELNSQNGQLYLAMRKNENFGNGANIGGLVMETPDGGVRAISGVEFDVDFLGPVNWRFRCLTLNRDFTGGAAQYQLVGTGAQLLRSVHLTFAAQDRVAFDVVNVTGGNVLKATDTGAEYARVSNIRLVTSIANRVNTTLTVNRAAGVNVTATVGSTAGMYVGQRLRINSTGNPSESVAVLSIGSATQFNATFVGNYVIGNAVQAHQIYADELVKAFVAQVAGTNSAQLSAATSLVQSPGLDMLDATLLDADMISEIGRLAALGDSSNRRWECGVGERQRVFFRPITIYGQTWYVDATDLQVARTVQNLANSVYAVYTDASGIPRRPTPQANALSQARYGVVRRIKQDASTSNLTLANVIASTQLGDTSDPKPRATIHFSKVFDANGNSYPLYLVRSGDTIVIRNLPSAATPGNDRIRSFRVTHTTYDLFADSLEVEPEAPPATLPVMLARKQEGIPK